MVSEHWLWSLSEGEITSAICHTCLFKIGMSPWKSISVDLQGPNMLSCSPSLGIQALTSKVHASSPAQNGEGGGETQYTGGRWRDSNILHTYFWFSKLGLKAKAVLIFNSKILICFSWISKLVNMLNIRTWEAFSVAKFSFVALSLFVPCQSKITRLCTNFLITERNGKFGLRHGKEPGKASW